MKHKERVTVDGSPAGFLACSPAQAVDKLLGRTRTCGDVTAELLLPRFASMGMTAECVYAEYQTRGRNDAVAKFRVVVAFDKSVVCDFWLERKTV